MRRIVDLRKNWKFASCDYPEGTVLSTNPWIPTTHSSIWDALTQVPEHSPWENVNLPHIWNKDSPTLAGGKLYQRQVMLSKPGEDNRYYLAFGGVFGLCRVFLNGKQVGEHRGGYSRFCVDLKDAVDGANTVTVFTDNTVVTDITPLSGDFAKYGGIYRETQLIQVGKLHFDLMHYGCPGVLVDTRADGLIRAEALVVGEENAPVRYSLVDAQGRLVVQYTTASRVAKFRVLDVIRWNGKKNPYLYTLTAELLSGDKAVDQVSLKIGFRDIQITADKGFFLNGEHIKLCGVAKHQDRADRGPAATDADLEEDVSLIREIGANAVRLSHYQHPQALYDLCDREGLLVWAEIPMLCMPDDNDDVMENARQQLTELVLQNRHHPSIIMWGVQNEIALMGQTDQQPGKVQRLHDLVRALKPDALTASANEYTVAPDHPLNRITDIQGYNLYYGWYYGEFGQLGDFFESFHKALPNVPIGISEYGVDCRTDLHQRYPKRQDYSEEYQCAFHEAAYPLIWERDYVWGSFIWNMFDFSSPYRGFEPLLGLNRKGLVTFDRKQRKDAFYFYKAWWSKEPVVHLCESRYRNRVEDTATVKVYSNRPEIFLTVNGKPFGTVTGKVVFRFENVPLEMGVNTVVASCGEWQDTMEICRVTEPDESYTFVESGAGRQARDWVKRKES